MPILSETDENVCAIPTHQGRFDANALGSLKSQSQIPDLKEKLITLSHFHATHWIATITHEAVDIMIA